MKKLINTAAVILILTALNYFGIVNVSQLLGLKFSQWTDTVLPCFVVLIFVNLFSGIRWIALNRLYGSYISLYDGLLITFKSGLFVYILPAQIGQEISRIMMAKRNSHEVDIAHAISATIIDRVIALFSQVCLLASFLCYLFTKNGGWEAQSFLALLLIFLVCSILIWAAHNFIRVIIFKFKHNKRIDYLGNILKIIKNMISNHPGYLALAIIFSSLLNIAVCFCLYLIVKNLLGAIDFILISTMTLASNLSSVIPASPGGIGVSELVFKSTGESISKSSMPNVATAYVVFRIVNILSFGGGMGLLKLVNSAKRNIVKRLPI
ncbi:flippase-like domain-containing protein [Chromobacterium vaccinii]|uniref:lysylphosphatidylglycerol synthase transmembrane domain-containing protein n=1 Tax=Chromobacterium vaccinii TaxID=1108595 RepID=UPI001E2E6387|nr:lysylphosphatidylglycerol synthase transmembrane domain-containing protein [Chromobacterium vaccinii]MCD4486434.1 flippase-like domain-containing protein [Chromobacterium vaccinii]